MLLGDLRHIAIGAVRETIANAMLTLKLTAVAASIRPRRQLRLAQEGKTGYSRQSVGTDIRPA